MRKMIFAGAALLLSTSAFAQIDYTAPTIEVAATEAELDLMSNAASANLVLRTVAVGSDGVLYGVDNSVDSTGLNSIDVSGVSPVVTLIEPLADILTAISAGDSAATAASTGTVCVDASDNVYLYTFTAAIDDILKITPGGVTTRLRQGDGVGAIAVNGAGSLVYLYSEANFGGDDSISSVDTTNADQTATVVADSPTIMAATGGAGVGGVGMAVLANGDIAFWNEFGFGGSDSIVSVTPAGVVSHLVTTATLTTAGLPFTANNYTMFGGPASDGSLFLFMDNTDELYIVTPTSPTDYSAVTVNVVTEATFASQTGQLAADPVDFKNISCVDDAGDVVVYVSDDDQDQIYSFRFSPAASAVTNWDLY